MGWVAGFGSGMVWVMLLEGRFRDAAIIVVMTIAFTMIVHGRLPGTAPR